MIPYFWGDVPQSELRHTGVSGVTFSSLLQNDVGVRELPEEVQQALGNQGEIRSARQLEAMLGELQIQQ